jgi:hypothetical protein
MYIFLCLTLLHLITNLHMSGSSDILQEGTVLGQVMSIVNNKGHIPSHYVVEHLSRSAKASGGEDLQVPGRAAGYPNGSPTDPDECD